MRLSIKQKEGLVHEEEHAKVEYIVAHGIATTLHGLHTVIGVITLSLKMMELKRHRN